MSKPRFTALEAEEMYYSGKTIAQLAREHNTSWNVVRGALRRAGFQPPEVSPEWKRALKETRSESASRAEERKRLQALADQLRAAQADRDYWYEKYHELLGKSPTSGPTQ